MCANTQEESALIDSEFLLPDESNFEAVIDKIRHIHRLLSSRPRPRPGRRWLAGQFLYADEVSRVGLPAGPSSFDDAIGRSLEAFEGCLNWHHPHALFNINPSPLLDTVALTAITALYNPNAIWDISSGKFTLIEQRTIAHLGKLAGWSNPVAGAFTSGGKATIMYAIKSGINRCDPDAVRDGLRHRYVVLTSASAHFSTESVCNYLGLGKDAVRRVEQTADGQMDMHALHAALQTAVDEGARIACILLTGGGTINMVIDPVEAVRDVVDRVARSEALTYVPHIHLDSVISWAWLAFTRDWPHPFAQDLPALVHAKIGQAAEAIAQVRHADSFGADFHKTGLSPYNASVYLTRDAQQFLEINRSTDDAPTSEHLFGDVCNFDRTLENSRSCTGIIAAYHVLQRLGVRGLQDHLTRLLLGAARLACSITRHHSDLMTVVNTQTLGYDVVVRLNLLAPIRAGWEELESPSIASEAYRSTADQFREWLTHGTDCNNEATPFLGYVPYYADAKHSTSAPAYLLYPNSIHLDAGAAADIAASLRRAVIAFRANRLTLAQQKSIWLGRPLPPR